MQQVTRHCGCFFPPTGMVPRPQPTWKGGYASTSTRATNSMCMSAAHTNTIKHMYAHMSI